MACKHIRLPDGTVVMVCGIKPARKKPCIQCGKPAGRECDWCDRPICSACSTRRGDVDACADHKYELQEREAIQTELPLCEVKQWPMTT
jgi:hypothetical protein